MAGAGSRRGGSSRGAGGGVGESVVAKQLHSAEDNIRLGKKETAVIRTADGRWEVIGGKKYEVQISTNVLNQLRGGLLTHNHPSTQLHRGKLGQLARRARSGDLTSPFSPHDLNLARQFGLREMRVVGSTRKYRYRPNGPDSSRAVQQAFKYGGEKAQRVYDATKRKWLARVNAASGARRERLAAQMDRALTGVLAGQSYIAQNYAMRSLRSLGYDLRAKRGRPLVTVKR